MFARSSVLLVSLSTVGCFSPDPPAGAGDTEEGSSTGAPDASESSGNGESSDPTMSADTDGVGTSSNPTDPSGTDTSADPSVCGDGEVTGEEACDDGINDGSYGGCAPDCTALGPWCGDGEVNGDEVCDDGENDGSYETCTPGCDAVPRCGDEIVQDEETCDEGADNENGSGCNLDCQASGSVVGAFEVEGLASCDDIATTRPAFRDNGNALVSMTGDCDGVAPILRELDRSLGVVDTFDAVAGLPSLDVAELVGERWIFADADCNYVLGAKGSFSEICDDRDTGRLDLLATGDDSYIAVSNNRVTAYGAGSPALGDTQLWSVPLNSIATGSFSAIYYASVGLGGIVSLAGEDGTQFDSRGFVAQVSSTGQLADTETFLEGGAFSDATDVATGPTGNVLVLARNNNTGTAVYRMLDVGLNEVWNVDAPSRLAHAAIDSAGDVVMVYEDSDSGLQTIQKLASDGASTRWLTTLDHPYERFRVDADDHVWLSWAGASEDGTTSVLSVIRVAP